MTTVVIPEHAWPQWRALQAVLADQPPPCTEQPTLWTDPVNTDVDWAMNVCRTRCPALVECGEYADVAGEIGVWGGEVR